MEKYKKLPPFGKIQRVQSEIFIFIGRNAWKKASSFQAQRPGTLCLPAYISPYDFNWPIKDSDITIFDTSWCSDDYIEDVVKCLFVYGANKIAFINSDYQFFIFKKGVL